MHILGFHGLLVGDEQEQRARIGGHDAAAVLLRDGELVAAFEEERLNRLKHANCFPVRAIRACLERGGLTSIDQIDCIAVNESESVHTRGAVAAWLKDPSASTAPDGRSRLASVFSRAFETDVTSRIVFCPHHLGHAWSTFVPSGFDECLVLVADGDGDETQSGMVLLGRGQELTVLREYDVSQSLGHLYESLIAVVGYGRFDEYKVMGLAPYGDPRVFRRLFDEGCRLLPEGNYALDGKRRWLERLQDAGLIAQARRKGEPFSPTHMNFAAALQEAIERVLLHVLEYYAGVTGQRNLCLAGGVAHNCSANGKVLASKRFDRVFVQPASHDAGGAYGAAVHAAREQGLTVCKQPWTHVFLGTDLGCGCETLAQLERWRAFIGWEHIGAVPDVPARLLADGAVIGWMQGRAEFGPRALGNRSILADPRPAENKGRINAMVKKREAYRPFAPAVRLERVRDYFEVPGAQSDFPFMVMVLKVRPEAQAQLGAITHVDGTARVQTVAREDNPRFWSLIAAFERATGVGMLLNTSFNNHAEPIVDSVDDAVTCFLTTGLDYLVVGDYLVRKLHSDIRPEDCGPLIPRLPHHRRLVKATRPGPRAQGPPVTRFVLESTRPSAYGPMDIAISPDMYRVLAQADQRCALSVACDRAGLTTTQRNDVYREAAQLWGNRAIALSTRESPS